MCVIKTKPRKAFRRNAMSKKTNMPNTYSQIYLQFIFVVKGRENLIKESFREELKNDHSKYFNYGLNKSIFYRAIVSIILGIGFVFLWNFCYYRLFTKF
jgi:hypothetical protein